MTAYNAKHPYEPDWKIPRGVWANGLTSYICSGGRQGRRLYVVGARWKYSFDIIYLALVLVISFQLMYLAFLSASHSYTLA